MADLWCIVSDSLYIKVIPGPSPVIDTGVNQACTDDPVLFTTGDNTDYTYQWTITVGADSVMESAGGSSHEPFIREFVGTKEVSVTITSFNGRSKIAAKRTAVYLRPKTGPVLNIQRTVFYYIV